MFKRQVQIGRAVVMYDNSYYGSCCYSLREWLNIDKIVRRQRVRFNIVSPDTNITGFIGDNFEI